MPHIKKHAQFWLPLLVLAFSSVSCGSTSDSEESEEDDEEGVTLTISAGHVFATPALTAPSGSTITVINNDDTPHTVTSQSAEDAFDDTGDFDVTVSSGGTALLTLPEAASGTVFFYYCAFHVDGMSPSSGTIAIE
ncbi:MAG: hypothetical protein HYU99_10215 [Deltaproteobacteria bacterium]|nr:hypothetical protein [Deltaproteobacteria bacterium]